MINNALSGRKLPVYGSGKNVETGSSADHCKAIDFGQNRVALGMYNVGGHNEKRKLRLSIILDTLLEVLPQNDERRRNISHIYYLCRGIVKDMTSICNRSDKIKAELG